MRTQILIVLCALATLLPLRAADRITATISVTNAPIGNTNKITINADTRSFTNSVTGSPGTLIQETNSIPWTATNLLAQLTTYRVSQFHFLGSSASTNVRVTGAVGEALTVTLAGGWGFVTYTTQTVSSPTFVVRVPMTVEQTSNRTHIASLLVTGMSDNSTNAFATNSTAVSNLLQKGIGPMQRVQSEVRFDGRTAVSSNFFATNGFTANLTNINPVNTNLVNYGNAIRSEGIGGNSLQVGSNAVAGSLRSAAFGVNSLATNTDSLAIGTEASATTNIATAIGNSALAIGYGSLAVGQGAVASNQFSTAIGQGAFAGYYGTAVGQGSIATNHQSIAIGVGAEGQGTNSIAIGTEVGATGANSTAIGNSSTAAHNDSTAVGRSALTTTTNQIRLGTSSDTVSVPGIIDGPTSTNATLRGTNVINGRIDFTSRANTALANGYNSGTVLGTNVYIKLSGPSAAHTNVGFASAVEGTWHKVQVDNPGLSYTLLNESGLEATPANRILTGIGALVNSTNNPVQIELIYDTAAARWRLLQIR
jgi:hypothetical protein